MKPKKYQSVVENSIALFALKAIDLSLTIGLIPYLVLKVGLHNYGMYAFAMALLLFLVNVMNYGFNLSTVREITKKKTDSQFLNKRFNEVFSVKLFLYLVSIFFLASLVLWVPKFAVYKTLLLYGSCILFAELFSTRWFFYGLEKMKFITVMSLIGNIIFVCLVLVFVREESDFTNIAMYEGLGMSVVSVCSFFLIINKYKFKLSVISIKEVIRYLKENFSSFINLLLPSTYNITLVFVVGLLGIPFQVSFIQIGVKLTSIYATIITVFSSVLYPIVNRNKRWMLPTRIMLNICGLNMTVIMFCMAEYSIRKWLPFQSNEELLLMIRLVQLLSITPFLIAITSSFGVNGLLVEYKDKLYSKITLFSTATMLISGVVLIPEYPFYGGVIAFLLGKTIQALLSFLFYKNKVTL